MINKSNRDELQPNNLVVDWREPTPLVRWYTCEINARILLTGVVPVCSSVNVLASARLPIGSPAPTSGDPARLRKSCFSKRGTGLLDVEAGWGTARRSFCLAPEENDAGFTEGGAVVACCWIVSSGVRQIVKASHGVGG